MVAVITKPLAAATLVAGLSWSSVTLGTSKQECVAAAQDAQSLRADAKLVSAREKLLICAREACPRVVRADCASWLTEVDQALPSLVVRVRDAGGADLAGALFLDGAKLRDSLDGAPVVLDPGPRRVRIELADGRSVEREVLVAAGEKNRLVVLEAPSAGSPAPGRGPPAAAQRGQVSEPPLKESSVAPWVIGGIGAVGLVTFGVLQVLARSEYDELEDGCGRARTCTDDELSPVRTKFVVSAVGLGVGVVGLGVAGTWLLVQSDGESGPRARLAVEPSPSGAMLRGGLSF